MEDFAWIGNCPICHQGRQIIAKENSTSKMYVVCEECESEWENPQDAIDKKPALRDTYGPSAFFSREEIAHHPWGTYLHK